MIVVGVFGTRAIEFKASCYRSYSNPPWRGMGDWLIWGGEQDDEGIERRGEVCRKRTITTEADRRMGAE